MSQVERIVLERGAEAAESITIEIGPLSGTEPDLLRGAFLVMRGGRTATATLVISRCPVSICCLQCGAESVTQPNRLICGACGGWRTRVIAGYELRLLRVELRMPGPAQRLDPQPEVEQVGHV